MSDVVTEREAGLAPPVPELVPAGTAGGQLVQERGQWQAMFHLAPHGMALVDIDGRCVAVNDALCRLLDRTPEDLLTTEIEALTHPDDRDVGLTELRRALDGERESIEVEKRYLRSDGEPVWTRLSVALLRDPVGQPLRFLAHLQDISAQKQAAAQLADYAEQLQELARRDPQTGLCNYRAFRTRLEAEMATAGRDRSQCSVVLFDIDNFRELNRRDRVQGDELLERVAGLLTDASRATDVAARIGPDEFALILPGAGSEQATAVAHRIAGEVGRDGAVSVSFGISACTADGDPAKVALLHADAMLQTAKDGLHRHAEGGTPIPIPAGSELDQIRQIVSALRRALRMDGAYLTQIEREVETVRVADGDAARSAVTEGGPAPSTEADAAVPVMLDGARVFGRLCLVGGAQTPRPAERDLELLRSLAGVIARTIRLDEGDAAARRGHEELAGMSALVSALSARDHYTGEHSKTVVRLAAAVARRMGLDDETVHHVGQVALVHDVGKVGIPDAIVQKEGPLTAQEWTLMREHPAIGARILAGTGSLAHLAPDVHAEHERFDGGGYPDGLRGEAIPIASRITLACDAYDAMTTDRPYRAGLGFARAIRELRAGAGTQFDPDVVEALVAELGGAPPITEA